MSLKKIFAQNLKQTRKKRGLTQEKLAELVEVAPRHISFLETGRSFPSSDLIERICTVLNIKYADLFNFEEEFSRDEIINRLSTILPTLDDEKLKYLYKLANEF